jgi:DNA-binding MarR family transcriptional regulator
MTDINDHSFSAPKSRRANRDRGFDGEPRVKAASDRDLIGMAEMLFFAYRDFISDPDTDLSALGFGRAHHRVLHFVNRHPGLRVADLLDILKITKQSLGRVLKQLIDQGYIAQEAGQADRRERLLYPTEQGRALAERLITPQLERLARALQAAGANGDQAVRDFLQTMVGSNERARVADLIAHGRERNAKQWTPS